MTSLLSSRTSEAYSQEQGRDQLIGALYRQHHGGLLRYLIARFGKSAPDPEDIVQSAFMKLANHPNIREISDYRAYLFTLACNIAIDNQRKNFRRGALQDELHAIADVAPALGASSERILIDREKLTLIEAALKKMPALRRRIFLLIRIEDMGVREVAARFGMSEAAVYKHVARALHDLAASLERAEQRANM
ncbi:RNA polymerase sigma factor [soil metagenome]